MLTPRTKAPELELHTASGGTWKLSEQLPENFTMIVFYRGLHCPVCKRYLQSLERRLDDFSSRGVEVIAISGDTPERAERAKQEWELEKLRIGYGQSIDSMREWGLFISRAIKESEPDLFGEPGLFLIRPDGTVYYEAIQSMPFGRPIFQEMLGAIDWVLQNDYPARGEVSNPGAEAADLYAQGGIVFHPLPRAQPHPRRGAWRSRSRRRNTTTSISAMCAAGREKGGHGPVRRADVRHEKVLLKPTQEKGR